MPVYRNEKEYFWGHIESNTEYEKYTEMYKLLNKHICDDEFYHLCKAFIDLPLNAPKYADNENLEIDLFFQDSAINKAKKLTQTFINTFSIQNIEELFYVIKLFYPYASNDNRQKSTILFNSSCVGKVFDLCIILDNFWEKFIQDIISANGINNI